MGPKWSKGQKLVGLKKIENCLFGDQSFLLPIAHNMQYVDQVVDPLRVILSPRPMGHLEENLTIVWSWQHFVGLCLDHHVLVRQIAGDSSHTSDPCAGNFTDQEASIAQANLKFEQREGGDEAGLADAATVCMCFIVP